MKQFLIGSFVLAFLLGSAPAMAESSNRGDNASGLVKVDGQKGGPQHKKFLTSRHEKQGRHEYRNERPRGHGLKHKQGRKYQKHHQRSHRYHGQKRHWGGKQHRHHRGHGHRGHKSGFRYHFRYNSGTGHGYSVNPASQLLINLAL